MKVGTRTPDEKQKMKKNEKNITFQHNMQGSADMEGTTSRDVNNFWFIQGKIEFGLFNLVSREIGCCLELHFQQVKLVTSYFADLTMLFTFQEELRFHGTDLASKQQETLGSSAWTNE
jgi:hypothetical protein